MGAMIRNDEQIKGITINEHEYKLLQYADDTALLLDGQENSLRRALSLIDQFSKYSGLKPNYSKTSCIRIGAYRYIDVQYCNEYNIQWADSNFTFLGIDFTVDLIDITDLNIDKRLTEISTVIKHWNRRIISTLGRITVLKTILLPKLTHIFMSLPDPSVAKVKYLESLFFKFIWCNKQDKINRKLAVQHPKDGGLNMVCIRSFINGLKITWVRRLLNTSNVSWSRFLEVIFPDLREGVSTFGNEYLKTIVSTANPFWSNVFTSLYDLRSIVDNDDFLVQSVWFNNNVQINGRSIFLRTWKNRGINHILDFFDANYVFLSYTDFCEKYMFNPPFTIFYGIVQSIKKYLVNNHIEYNIDTMSVFIQRPLRSFITSFVLKHDKGASNFYRAFISKQYEKPKCELKWEGELNFHQTVKWWKLQHKIIFLLSDIRLRWLQYRIVHRILGTNSLLYKMGISESNLCTFCTRDVETSYHLFYGCDIVSNIWDSTVEYINTSCETSIALSLFDIIFGHKNDVLNLLLCVIKSYIFRQRNNANIPTLIGIKNELSYYLKIQRNIYLSKGQIETFLKKWDTFLPLELLR